MRYLYLLILPALLACGPSSPQSAPASSAEPTPAPLRVILDTDANNELDDQHAMAYMLLQPEVFAVEGITVNATFNGGPIEDHVAEAARVMALCAVSPEEVPLVAGVSEPYRDLLPRLTGDYPGKAAVDFIIAAARADDPRPLHVVAIGSFTHVALALAQAPDIVPRIRVMWLGSNWPNPGEYNLQNDTTAVNPVLEMPGLAVDIATVRYGEPSGSAAVTVSVAEVRRRMPGLGPVVDSVAGRHGGRFATFGDYSVSLFEHIGDDTRALFDLCALAILKEPAWAQSRPLPAPRLQGEAWVERPDFPRQVTFWENFDREAILTDFFAVMERAQPRP